MVVLRRMALAAGSVVAAALAIALALANPGSAAGRIGERSLPKVSGFGDSVMLGAKPDMLRLFHGGRVNAAESRQADPTLAAVRRAAHASRLRPLVVLHIGTNGTIDRGPFRRTLRLLQTTPRVRLIEVLTVHVPQPWQTADNRLIRHVTSHFSRAVVVDWHGVADRHPGWLYSDHVHLTPAGQHGYSRMLRSAYRAAT